MSEQIFVSYRREGGDVTAKLICEALKNRGYTVFYDYDSICGGYFDDRIITAIEACNDFVLVLPKNALDRCVNDDDWVRQEIACALKHGKNIIPILAPDFAFPKELPKDIEDVSRINGIRFVMAYFEAMMTSLTDRLTSRPTVIGEPLDDTPHYSTGLDFVFDEKLKGYKAMSGLCTDTEVVIPPVYDGKKVVSVGGFREYTSLKKVILPDTVIKIEESAFHSCTMLEEMNIPNSVTEIGGWAFSGCTSLKNIAIPKNVTSIGLRALTNCVSLEFISVEADNGVYCSVDGNLYTKNKKTLIAYAVGKEAADFAVPEDVCVIGDSAFSYAKNIVSVTMPDSVTDISIFAFYLCPALEKVCLSKNVKLIGQQAFEQCALLKHIEIPESVTEIGKIAFYGCKSLTDIYIPKNVQRIGEKAFAACTAVESFSVSAESDYFCSVDGNLYTKDMKALLAYCPANKKGSFSLPAGVQIIQDCAFSECSNIRCFTASNELRSIGCFAFYRCSALKEVNLPKTMSNIGDSAFKECKSLESIVIPQGISNIAKETFRDCVSLKTVTLPRGLLGIDEGAFNTCVNVEKIDIPDSVTLIGKWAFYGCSSLKNIKIPKKVSFIGARSFTSCTALEAIKVSPFNKDYRNFGVHLYTKDMKTIVAYALASKDVSYVLPDSVKIINDSAFSYSVNLTNLSLPRDLESIGDFGLYNCAALKQINYKGTLYAWKAVTLGSSVLMQSGTNKITCTDGTVDI